MVKDFISTVGLFGFIFGMLWCMFELLKMFGG